MRSVTAHAWDWVTPRQGQRSRHTLCVAPPAHGVCRLPSPREELFGPNRDDTFAGLRVQLKLHQATALAELHVELLQAEGEVRHDEPAGGVGAADEVAVEEVVRLVGDHR